MNSSASEIVAPQQTGHARIFFQECYLSLDCDSFITKSQTEDYEKFNCVISFFIF